MLPRLNDFLRRQSLPPLRIEVLAETTSAMDAVRERLDEGWNGETAELVLAESQTKGRGQRGTHWESEPGKNLTFALLFSPNIAAHNQFLLSEIAALAFVDALNPYCEATVKWPNDIYFKDRKLCGMLLEHRLQGDRIDHTVLGPGLNVNQALFKSDAPNPISLMQILGQTLDRKKILENYLTFFFERLARLQSGDLETQHAEYRAKLFRGCGFHAYRDADGPFEAEIADIGRDGRLTLRDREGKKRTYAFKEVAYVLENKENPTK